MASSRAKSVNSVGKTIFENSSCTDASRGDSGVRSSLGSLDSHLSERLSTAACQNHSTSDSRPNTLSVPSRGRQTTSKQRPNLPDGGKDNPIDGPSPSGDSGFTSTAFEAPLLSFFNSGLGGETFRSRSLLRHGVQNTQSHAGLLGMDGSSVWTRHGGTRTKNLQATQDAMDAMVLPVCCRFFWLFAATAAVLVYRGLFLVYLLVKNMLSDDWSDVDMFLYYALAEVLPVGLLLALIFMEEISYCCRVRGLRNGGAAKLREGGETITPIESTDRLRVIACLGPVESELTETESETGEFP